MSGLTLSTIREALADQLKAHIARDVTVRSYRPAAADGPSITVDAAADYIDYWTTMSKTGISAVRFDLRVVAAGADYESSLRRLDDFLSAGDGNGSSVLDAVMFDVTLGIEGANAHVVAVSVDADSAAAVVTVEVHVPKRAAA